MGLRAWLFCWYQHPGCTHHRKLRPYDPIHVIVCSQNVCKYPEPTHVVCVVTGSRTEDLGNLLHRQRGEVFVVFLNHHQMTLNTLISIIYLMGLCRCV